MLPQHSQWFCNYKRHNLSRASFLCFIDQRCYLNKQNIIIFSYALLSKAALKQPSHGSGSLWGKQWLLIAKHNEITLLFRSIPLKTTYCQKEWWSCSQRHAGTSEWKTWWVCFHHCSIKGSNNPLHSPTHPSLIPSIHPTPVCRSPFLLLKHAETTAAPDVGRIRWPQQNQLLKRQNLLEYRDEQVTQGCETVGLQWNVPSLTKTVCIACISCKKNHLLLSTYFWIVFVSHIYCHYTAVLCLNLTGQKV